MAQPASLPSPRLSRRMRQQEAPPSVLPPATVPVSAYRARLEELLVEVGRGDAAAPAGRSAQALASDARQLASDLESVLDLLPAPWTAVPELLNALASALSHGDRAAVTSLVARIVEAVATDVDEAALSPGRGPRRRPLFWR